MDFDLQDKPSVGPALKDVCKLFSGVFKAMGMTYSLVGELPGAFKTAGLENVYTEIVELPMGKLLGGEEATEMSLQPFLLTIPSLIQGAKGKFITTTRSAGSLTRIGLKADVPESVLQNLPERFGKEIREQGGIFYTKVITGQKPV